MVPNTKFAPSIQQFSSFYQFIGLMGNWTFRKKEGHKIPGSNFSHASSKSVINVSFRNVFIPNSNVYKSISAKVAQFLSFFSRKNLRIIGTGKSRQSRSKNNWTVNDDFIIFEKYYY